MERSIQACEEEKDAEWGNGMVTSLLSTLFQPFALISNGLNHQINSVCRREFADDREKFLSHFLYPAYKLLSQLQLVTRQRLKDSAWKRRQLGWPLCSNRPLILIQIGPQSPSDSLFHTGDYYFYVAPDSSQKDVILCVCWLANSGFWESEPVDLDVLSQFFLESCSGNDGLVLPHAQHLDPNCILTRPRFCVVNATTKEMEPVTEEIFEGAKTPSSLPEHSVKFSYDLVSPPQTEWGGGATGEESRASTSPHPRTIDALRSDLFLRRLLSYSDAELSDIGGVVEIRCEETVLDFTPHDFARALGYLHFWHTRLLRVCNKRRGKSEAFTLIVDVENSSSTFLDLYHEALKIFKDFLSTESRKGLFSLWVDQSSEEDLADQMAFKALREKGCTSVQGELITVEELRSRIPLTYLGKEFGGERPSVDMVQWVQFRKDLEEFLSATRGVGESFVDLYKDMRRTTGVELWNTPLDELNQWNETLRTKYEKILASSSIHFLTENGEERLHHLLHDFHSLDNLTSYRKATQKAKDLFLEVQKIMSQAGPNLEARRGILQEFISAKTFIVSAKQIINWVFSVAFPKAHEQEDEPTVSLIRLRMQEKEFEAFLEDAKAKMKEGEELLDANRKLWNSQRAANANEKKGLSTEQLREVEQVWTDLMEALEACGKALSSARETLADRLVCHHMLDKAYDWALHNAKLSSQLGVLLSTKALKAPEAIEENLSLVRAQLESYPQSELEQLPEYAARLTCAKLLAQTKSIIQRCQESQKSLLRYQTLLENQRNGGEEVTAVPVQDTLHIERATSLRNRRCSQSSSIISDSGKLQENIPPDFITKDYTYNVVSSMSQDTISKKLANRKGSKGDQGWSSVLLRNRFGSARMSKEKPMSTQERASTAISTSRPPPSFYGSQCSLPSLVSFSDESNPSARSNTISSGSSVLPLLPLAKSEDSPDETGSSQCSVPCDDLADISISVKHPILKPLPPEASGTQKMEYNIARELLETEINYVQHLQFVVQWYIPEMKRVDLPHQLRGQRPRIFGNMEKIFYFHVTCFLPELESRLLEEPDSLSLAISECFLKHEDRFHLYALYSKNKPASEALMSECGSNFFESKDVALGDRLGLASYLLKPIQRMGKYGLLLEELIKICSPGDQEVADSLRRAKEMISFQQRHGNDLLAMDMIRGCDLNLKEHGQLLRQADFIVSEGRTLSKKSQRRVFLFEQLLLFTKPRRGVRPALSFLADTYQYKHSIKMLDAGLTEKFKDSPLKFEIWFRRRTSSQSFVLQCSSSEAREAWVGEISKLLWRQALQNRAARLEEISSLGMDERPSLNLESSSDKIRNRSVNPLLVQRLRPPLRHSHTWEQTISEEDSRSHSAASTSSDSPPVL